MQRVIQSTISFYVMEFYKQFAAYTTQQLQEFGLSFGMMYFVIYVGKHPGCTPAEMTKNLHLDWGHCQRSVITTKVDRSAAYMARKIAKDIVQAGYADKCEVQLAYAIGVVQPVGVAVECFGTEHQPLDFIQAYVKDSYDLTPQGIIQRLGLLDVDYNKVSAYGHFGKPGLPWEE